MNFEVLFLLIYLAETLRRVDAGACVCLVLWELSLNCTKLYVFELHFWATLYNAFKQASAVRIRAMLGFRSAALVKYKKIVMTH